MQIGDVVEVINPQWTEMWNGIVCIVTDIDDYVRLLPITIPLPPELRKHLNGRAGFRPESLKVLDHIDVAGES